MSIASNLRREIDEQGITIAYMASKVGAEPSTIRKYLSGKARPNNAVLARLATVLNTTPEEIKFGKHERRFGKITTDEASAITGIDPLSLRIGLQRGIWPFGVAYKRPGSSKYTYEYDPEALIRYTNARHAMQAASHETRQSVPATSD